MKKMLFVYNPRAGRELLKQVLSDIIDIFVKADYEVVIYPTQSYHDAYRKIVAFEEEYDLIVCSGGDGTIDEVVTGMMNREKRVPIGYIPTGTTNDFANSLKIPRDLYAAASNAVSGFPFPCDVGRFNDGIFVYVAAFGLFTDVSYETDQTMKNLLGHLAYVLEGAKKLFNVPSYRIRVEHDGEIITDEFIFGMVTNSRSVGGFRSMVGKDVKFDDGVFEVTLIRRPKNPIELQEIIASLLIEQINTDHMYTFKAKKISFESEDEIPWTLDGENGGTHDYVEILNDQKAIQLVVPEKYVSRLSIDGEKVLKK
ncbi:MAG: YegS/Rv2252/BmrU family lipid kinase [Eubacteriales bacterium]|nr:YegS/Rv2252/BmrU family lipid kinase [Eubacteriales bacterium]